MEQSNGLNFKFKDLEKAIYSFSKSLKINYENLDDTLLDIVKNGQIQKFEYTFELLWKYLKKYLWEIHGIDAKSPKVSLKEAFLMEIITEHEYELLAEMLNNRNLISHVYREEFFNKLSEKLFVYAKIMKSVVEKISE
jgi:nucleotidyltransferase substrate binding protein (TIGR01987 family)